MSMIRIALLAWLLAGCEASPAACGPTSARVARVVDGDTVVLESGEKIRYLLVDTPESVNGADDCFGHEAAQLNRDLVLGKQVTLRYDDAACHDRFGRLLAYVSVDGREINQLLVERGYACVLYLPPAGAERVEALEAVQADARAQRRGMWSACQEVACER